VLYLNTQNQVLPISGKGCSFGPHPPALDRHNLLDEQKHSRKIINVQYVSPSWQHITKPKESNTQHTAGAKSTSVTAAAAAAAAATTKTKRTAVPRV